ncbi:MAG: hypothetical protein D3910_08085 [Candidatus Electrothrix sp. ATG2]|nr:hypothetical protein [Candidatus Electrothrix sp. ATG2]
MAYTDFKTLSQVEKDLEITIEQASKLYVDIPPIELSSWFLETMELSYDLAINMNTEAARQSLIVDNVLIELKKRVPISLFIKKTFNVDASRGLTGNPDGLVSLAGDELEIKSPVITLVEAKNNDINPGFPQCIAEMVAAALFNQNAGISRETIYGVVTDGVSWRFISLQEGIATIDRHTYLFNGGSQIIAILQSFLSA